MNPWTRAVHAYLRARELELGRPFGLTFEEAEVQLGPAPFTAEVARRMLKAGAAKGWFTVARESAETGRMGGCQVRVRYFAAAEMPDGAAPQKLNSFFDGLVRASSVFELARIVGAQHGAAS